MQNKSTGSITFYSTIIASTIWSMLPHTTGTSPLIVLALWSSKYSSNRYAAFLLALLPALIHDLICGAHSTQGWVYLSLIGASLLGNYTNTFFSTLYSSILASGLFFICTNVGVWISTTMYTYTLDGLLTCFIAALPFAWNQLLATLILSLLWYSSNNAASYLTAKVQLSTLK